MKILHTSDWHLGHMFFGHNRAEEHRSILFELIELSKREHVNALLICGDIFDSYNPSAESESIWFSFLANWQSALPGVPVFAIAGNHDAAGRLEAPARLLRNLELYVCGVPHFLPTEEEGLDTDIRRLDPSRHLFEIKSQGGGCVQIGLIPFLRPTDYPSSFSPESGRPVGDFLGQIYQDLACNALHPLVLMGHFYATGGAVSELSERKIQRGNQEAFALGAVNSKPCYFALGHLHRPQFIAAEKHVARYCGSLLPLSFEEVTYHHGVSLVQWELGHELPTVSHVSLKQPRKLISLCTQLFEQDAEMEITNSIQALEAADALPPFVEIKCPPLVGRLEALRKNWEELLQQKSHILVQITTRLKPQHTLPDQLLPKDDGHQPALGELSPWDLLCSSFQDTLGRPPSDLEKKIFDGAVEQAEENILRRTAE